MTPTIIKNCTLYNMDCMEYMKLLPDNAFDLAIVDPPYGIERFEKNVESKSRKTFTNKLNDWDKKPTKEYFNELFRVSKNQIIWGANHFWENNLPNCPHFIIWDKQQPVPNFAFGEMAWTSFSGVAKKIQLAYYGNIGNDIGGRMHPTQKPVKLYEWLLTNYAKQGDKILDTHLGSGSHAIACNNLGFELVGLELDSDYFKASCERITKEAQQERLF